MSFLFGGSKQKQESHNVNNPLVTNSLSPVMGMANTGASAIKNLLLGGDTSGFNMFKQNAGFNAAAQEGSNGIMANAAARGLLRSGASGKALVRYGNDLGQQYMGQYLSQLLGLSNLGIQAGNTIGGVGQVSSGSSSSKPGLGGFIGGILGR